MEEILACRVCFATDVKLFDVFSNKLVSAYEMITGVQISSTDGLPHKTCSYCGVTLLKLAAFSERCLHAEQLLGILAKRGKITTDTLRVLDRSTNPPQPRLITECAFSLESKVEIKEENDTIYHELHLDVDLGKDNKADLGIYNDTDLDIDNTEVVLGIDNKADLGIDNESDLGIDNDIKSEASDEEPLSKKVERKNGDCEPSLIKEELEGAPEIDLIFLSKAQQVEELRKRMGSLNYKNSLYKCEFCYKGFMTDVTYKNHMVRHDPKSGKHRCSVCSTYCESGRALRGHAATAHERSYVCRLCDYKTKSGSRAREHSRWHLGHTFVCQLCGACFAKSTSYLTHVRLQHPSQHCCALCGESFIGKNGLNMHIKKAHRLQESGLLSRCAGCGAGFRSEPALDRHHALGCDAATRPCLHCGESFLSDEKLNEHFKAAHKAEATKCEECGKSFSSERSFAIHRQRLHVPRGPRPAPAKLPARNVVCELCGQPCHSLASLAQHQRTHSGERPHACSRCPKAFSNPQLLQVHTRTHTGERPYKCEVCAKGFVHKAALNRHVRVHTGEKPYGCQHCGKAFSQSNSMKLHVRTVHLKLPAPYRQRRKELTT